MNVWRDRADHARALHKLKYPDYKFDPRPSKEINRRNKKLAKRANDRASSPSTIGEDDAEDFGAAPSPEGGVVSQGSTPVSNAEFNFHSAPELPVGSLDIQQEYIHEKEDDNSPAVFGTGASPEEQFGNEPFDFGLEDFSMFPRVGMEQQKEQGYGQEDFFNLAEAGNSHQEDKIETDKEFYSRLFEMGDSY